MEVRLLERIEFPVQVDCGNGASRFLVNRSFACQAPVVGESGGSRMLFAQCDLLVVEIEFGAVAPGDQHRVSPLMLV